MKILILNGSLRRHGSTEGVINIGISHLGENHSLVHPEVVHLCDQKIAMCDSCYECDRLGACWISDGVHPTVEKMLNADAIIYATPVHAFGVNSLMQIFLERAGVGYLRHKRPLEAKLAGVNITGRLYSHEVAWGQIALNISLNKMTLIGSGFPALIKNDGKRLGEVIVDDEGLVSVKDMLDKMVQIYGLLQTKKEERESRHHVHNL